MGIGGERAMAESRSVAPVTPLRGAPIHPSDEDLSLGTPASCSAQDDKSWLNGYWWRTRHGGKQVLRSAYPTAWGPKLLRSGGQIVVEWVLVANAPWRKAGPSLRLPRVRIRTRGAPIHPSDEDLSPGPRQAAPLRMTMWISDSHSFSCRWPQQPFLQRAMITAWRRSRRLEGKS